MEVADPLRVRLGLSKKARLLLPPVETRQLVATICSDEDFDVAALGAIDNMFRLLTKRVGIPLNEADMLMSILG